MAQGLKSGTHLWLSGVGGTTLCKPRRLPHQSRGAGLAALSPWGPAAHGEPPCAGSAELPHTSPLMKRGAHRAAQARLNHRTKEELEVSTTHSDA